ncbi:hypothetical protein [Salinigranum marinum]|uniref:hypothetical protein n=1 Tax=Salinigranum marinum TaxID=1515595 RepID=UPI002989DD8E|nr:hypothetical protein [Salinigranum marinum]
MTRFKLLPPAPETLDGVVEAQRAVPLVPGTEDDCCARLVRRLALPSRDVARTWLTFLRALGLAAERESGFVRLTREPTPGYLRAAFLDGVYGAREINDALGPRPVDADAVFERFEARVPEWERHKDPARWRDTWRERVDHLLDWLVLLDLAARESDGYVAAEPPDGSVENGG